MTWFKVDDGLAFHAKVVQAGNPAMGLWVRAGSWCAQQLTDGFVPDHIVTTLGTRAQAAKLTESRLWVRADGGFQFHGWNEDGRQPTREQVEKDRSEAKERMRKAREAKRGSGDVQANTDRTSGEVRSTRPDPSRPDPSFGSSSKTSGGNVQEVDGRDADEPPRCIRHNNLPRYEEPPCKTCERLRVQWEQQRDADRTFDRRPWCGECAPHTRLREYDDVSFRCPECHPLAEEAS